RRNAAEGLERHARGPAAQPAGGDPHHHACGAVKGTGDRGRGTGHPSVLSLLCYNPPPEPCRAGRLRRESHRKKLSEVFMKSWTVRVLVLAMLLVCVAAAHAQSVPAVSHPSANPAIAPQESAMAGHPTQGSEANLILPDLSRVSFLHGAITGQKLLVWGLLVCLLGLLFGLVIYIQLKNLPVHRSMRE